MYKVVKIEDKNVPMMSNGGTLREYRHFFKRDFLSDLIKIKNGKKNGDLDTEVFENIAWILAHRANQNIDPIDDWLAQFEDPFAIINAFDEIEDLLDSSASPTIPPKKKNHPYKKKK